MVAGEAMRRSFARWLAPAIVLGPLVAQTQPTPQRPPPPGPPPSAEVDDHRAFGGLPEARILEAIHGARVLGRNNVGSTSVNLHLHLQGGIDASFKPRTTTHGDKYRAEIAAYRLNRMLGLTRVPPAITRSVPRSILRLAPDSPAVYDRDNTLRGAAIYWVPVLRPSRVDEPAEQERWGRWLRAGHAVPPDQSVRAEEISTLLVFDFLTGNWDRWSGANVPMDAQGHLIYRDNNGAFDEPFVDGLLQRSRFWLQHTQQFNRSVITRARGLTEASVRAEMALDPEHNAPPLTSGQIRSLLRRRDLLLEYVEGLRRHHSDADVYRW